MDACELVKETEADLEKLKRKRGEVEQVSVKASSRSHPYTERNYHVEGLVFNTYNDNILRQQEVILGERMRNAEAIKNSVDEYLNTAPVRMQRIIRYKYFEGLTWEQVAIQMKGNSSGDSIRKEIERFLN